MLHLVCGKCHTLVLLTCMYWFVSCGQNGCRLHSQRVMVKKTKKKQTIHRGSDSILYMLPNYAYSKVFQPVLSQICLSFCNVNVRMIFSGAGENNDHLKTVQASLLKKKKRRTVRCMPSITKMTHIWMRGSVRKKISRSFNISLCYESDFFCHILAR